MPTYPKKGTVLCQTSKIMYFGDVSWILHYELFRHWWDGDLHFEAWLVGLSGGLHYAWKYASYFGFQGLFLSLVSAPSRTWRSEFLKESFLHWLWLLYKIYVKLRLNDVFVIVKLAKQHNHHLHQKFHNDAKHPTLLTLPSQGNMISLATESLHFKF
jgi:hypothetical protein